MKKIFIYIILAIGISLGVQSCQNLDQDFPMDYPDANDVLVGDHGEAIYFPFDEDFEDEVYSVRGDKVKEPTLVDGKIGKAYAGVTDGYLSLGGGALLFKKDWSISFWYKLNTTPDRAGIISLCKVKEKDANGVTESDDFLRKFGFRLFREGSTTSQTIVANFGDGINESSLRYAGALNDEWLHITFTTSASQATLYINGEVAGSKTTDFAGIEWRNIVQMSIGSGAPNFSYWNHKSDLSLIDELRVFNKELSASEVKTMMELK